MTVQNLTVNDKRKWINSAKVHQQIQDIYDRIVSRRTLSLWRRYEIYSNNLSLLEEQQSQGQDDVRIHNQIEDTRQKMTDIEQEIKGERGLLFQVCELFCEDRKIGHLPRSS